jgi:succinate dehydrogenase / fumarate reductase, cytochrome b subunit
MSSKSFSLPQAFVWRRLHSLMGLWLVLFLIEHLLVNSQAALWLGDNGKEFVSLVNGIHDLPYLQVIEILLLGIPILIHLIWGVKYLFTSEFNSYKTDGSKPSLPEYGRNRAYTWQRITSWILIVGLAGHIVKFRFLDYPTSADIGTVTPSYFVRVSMDNGLPSVARRLGVTLYNRSAIEDEEQKFQGEKRTEWINALTARALSEGEVIAQAQNFGTASLLAVRDTFKSPVYVGLYTIFVLAACFHAFNGFWTFLITWGVVLKVAAQKFMVNFAIGLMLLITFLGLIAIWGTYWLNLKS